MRNKIIRKDLAGTEEGERHVTRVALWFLAILALVFGPFLLLPKLTGSIYPVMTGVQLIDPHELSGGTMTGAIGTKSRPHCNWRGTAWYLGERGGHNVLLTTDPHQDEPKIRRHGIQTWSRIFIPGVLPDQMNNTFADVTHVCPPGVTVISPFWN